MKLLLDRGYKIFNDNWSHHGALVDFSWEVLGVTITDVWEETPYGLDLTTLDVITRITKDCLDFIASRPGYTAEAL